MNCLALSSLCQGPPAEEPPRRPLRLNKNWPSKIVPPTPLALPQVIPNLVDKMMTDDDNDNSQSLSKHDYFLPHTPDVLPLEVGQRLIEIGDIHGDYTFLRQCLIAAGVIGVDKDNWIGGNTICVQTGDIMDRGYEEEKCLLLLTKLARQAKIAGGALIILWGNHEILNAEGDFCCSTDDNAFEEQFAPYMDQRDPKWREKYGPSMQARFAAFEPGGLLAEPLLSKFKISVQVGRTVLVHGGLTKTHLDGHGGIAGMNKIARDWISKKIEIPPCKQRASWIHQKMHSLLHHNSSSPTFMRAYSKPPNVEPTNVQVAAKVDAVLGELNADRVVVGHSIQDTINSALNGKIWRVDTGRLSYEVLQITCSAPDKPEEVSIICGEDTDQPMLRSQ